VSVRGAVNRRIVILAEGDTERAARNHIKRFVDGRAGNLPKVRLETSIFDGGLTEQEVRGRTTKFLSGDSTLGVIALVDMYPQFKGLTPARAKKIVRSWMPDDPRCHAHVAKHDFEAWLLHGWDALLKQSGVTGPRKRWSPSPEEVNHDNPPARRVRALFQEGKPPRKYKKPVDGMKLFEKLDLAEVASVCPELKSFLDKLLQLCGYPLL